MAFKVFLSPSNQPRNMCKLGHSEKEHCEELAKKLAFLLNKNGIETRFRDTSKTLTVSVNEANAWGADLYLPLHTNAAGGTARGTRFGYYEGRGDSIEACKIFRENFKKIYPNPDRVKICPYPFSEAKRPKCPSVYCETVFHDNRDDAEWFHMNMDRIALNFLSSIAEILNINVNDPPKEPEPKNVSDTIVRLKITREENAAFHKKNINDIIEIPLEEYLLGVVPAEIGNPHIEAAKAQAIAARTYAYVRVKDGQAIDDTTKYQAYRAPRSIGSTYAISHQAVKDTAGQVLAYNGKVIETAVYSHSNGGTMVSAKERWGGDNRPYLISAEDPWTKATGIEKNGHAVGMSQVGAIYAAEHGITHQRILAFYYPGTSITNIEATPPVTPPVVTPNPPTPPEETKPLYEAMVVTRNPLSLNIWSNTRKGSSLKQVPKGAMVEVLEEVNATWAKVRYGGVVGYSDRQYLKRIDKNAIYNAEVVTMYPLSLNIWKEPKKGVSLAKVPKGAILNVLSEYNSTWAKVRYGDIVGYSDRKYLKKV